MLKTKLNADGSINKYKTRLIMKGHTQISIVNYFDTFAPVARQDTIRMLLVQHKKDGKCTTLMSTQPF